MYGLNLMAGVVEGFRWRVLGSPESRSPERRPGPLLAVSAAAAVAILVGGVLYFRGMEQTFADTI